MEARLLTLAERLDGYIDTELTAALRREVSYGEYGVGLENLCEQMFEADARLPRELIDEIGQLATTMGLPPQRWEYVNALQRRSQDE